ncbi:PP2C family protein-serine/threonine phosphatase [Mycobacterium sp. MS1601]|uniref:PP2C family protein-serine/threonine phosphatase n=1 Tax=Mycobacterium sp. MS1601 TaxID=1936029 RepID=UPI0009FA5BE0|nr:GAF domain-containing SpoIIE family protein phosphatase [Mycobacterium sp. MS1601]
MSGTSAPGRSADDARQRAVERYRILDVPPDRVFDRIAALAARVCGVPMAKVSIVDRDRIWFMAAHGLDAEVRQVAPDEGLCAAVITDQIPHTMSDALADPRTAHNPFVRMHGIRFYACAPITTSDGHRLGTVAVMDSQVHPAADRELAVLEDLAAIVMEQLEWRLLSLEALRNERRMRDHAQTDRDDAVTARDEARVDRDIAERERDVIQEFATALQKTLLPPTLPKIDGLDLACHYHPASARQVGGDFYDVFALGGERWAFFIGDVEGHGVGAAVATSLIRYTLRAAALHCDDPKEALSQLNTVLLREIEPRRFCTVLYGTLQPHPDGEGFLVTMATGGHPPALLLDSGQAWVRQVRSPGGMLVGALANARFDVCTANLRPGQTLLFYTDGIIEARRGETPFGEESLAAYALERADLGAAGLVADLATLIPKLEPGDDVALLAFGASPRT